MPARSSRIASSRPAPPPRATLASGAARRARRHGKHRCRCRPSPGAKANRFRAEPPRRRRKRSSRRKHSRPPASRPHATPRSIALATRSCAASTGWPPGSRARDLGAVALDTQTTSLDPMQATLCGFSLALAANEACYVPLGHRKRGDGGDGSLFAGEIAPDQIEERAALEAMKPLLEDAGVL